jgi:hypothetical protein
MFMQETYNTLNENSIGVYSVKSDAFTIHKRKLDKVIKLVNFGDEIGTWRISKNEDILIPSNRFHNDDDKPIEKIKEYRQTQYIIKDEWDSKSICKNVFMKHKLALILGEYAGCGKTHCCKYMKDMGYKVLFVYPNNKQVKVMNTSEGIDAVTLNTFFSMGVTEEQRMKKFDDREYDCIVFDEIFNHNVYGLRYIRKYILDNTQKIILGLEIFINSKRLNYLRIIKVTTNILQIV